MAIIVLEMVNKGVTGDVNQKFIYFLYTCLN